MYKRCEKPAPDTTIDISVFGDPCSIYQNMLNRIDALRRLQAKWPRCDISRFNVQFQLIDAMTYMFTIEDKANGETYEWSVRKEWTKEPPELAFERDYNESALRYNKGVVSALDDYLEAIDELNPERLYRQEETAKGYRVWRPIMGGLGLTPFEVSFTGIQGIVPLGRALLPDIDDFFGNIPGEPGRAIKRLIKRLTLLGVVFDQPQREIVKDYRRLVLTGKAYRTATTQTEVRIVLQEIALADDELYQYHQYFTE